LWKTGKTPFSIPPQGTNMRVVIQRVNGASVSVDGMMISQIGHGLLLLVGIQGDDTLSCIPKLYTHMHFHAPNRATKILKLRLFSDSDDAEGGNRWKRSLLNLSDSSILAISQFTLHANVSKGNKPDFHRAMKGGEAKGLFDEFVKELRRVLGDAERVKGDA
jgi:D-aminoacyl-tRNA deacylase